MIKWLKNYIATTPKETIEREWEEIEKLNLESIDAKDFFAFSCNNRHIRSIITQRDMPDKIEGYKNIKGIIERTHIAMGKKRFIVISTAQANSDKPVLYVPLSTH